ncbi:coiled-coil and C2 domain containing 1B [Phyllostomus discolor]|uniref:Coiled-coil and C2 domain containing 1B n=1 Tax=Phyllostomus discolor TaxID=89673 RepID=A0A834E8J0_9CHIR|nr:coiled-coil and C2 domain containing 1B [Phyllostomus discolor]
MCLPPLWEPPTPAMPRKTQPKPQQPSASLRPPYPSPSSLSPTGFPPIPGVEPTTGTEEDAVAATLAAAQKLASSEDIAPAEEDGDEDEDEPPAQAPVSKKPLIPSSRSLPEPKASSSKESLSPSVREQLALLEARKLQYQRAALQAKRGRDLEQAKAHLRLAKCLEAQIIQVRAGRPLDLSKVSPPGYAGGLLRQKRRVASLTAGL